MMTYDRYKASKTAWMGKVPEHWKIERAKWHFTLRNERGNENPVLLAATQKNGMYPQDKVEGVVKVAEGTDVQQFRTVHKNDFVITDCRRTPVFMKQKQGFWSYLGKQRQI